MSPTIQAASQTISWLQAVIAGLAGGVGLKLLEYSVSGAKYIFKERKDAKAVVDKHLDPVLKAADAICGKTISLAERDFSAPNGDLSGELEALTYLYAAFWSQLVILDRESLGISLKKDPRGKRLVAFRACLESQRIRLVNKTHQIAIGDIASDISKSPWRTKTIIEFTQDLAIRPELARWIAPLSNLLVTHKQRKVRQRILIYGVVLHAMIDSLDKRHDSTHYRTTYPNKLSRASKKTIEHLVFKRYLAGIVAPSTKYINKRAPAERISKDGGSLGARCIFYIARYKKLVKGKMPN